MSRDDLFTSDFSTTPYWLEQVDAVPIEVAELPARADLVVLGSGYTGLHAALVAARAGRDVLVLEAGEPGQGCSTRNGGQISPGIKPGLSSLSKRFGRQRALAILLEGYTSVAWLGDFIATEQIECNYSVCGSFHGAHSPARYRALERELADEDPALPSGGQLLSADAMSAEIATRRYFGGVVYPQDASIQPALYHQGLLRKVIAAGARIFPHTPASAIRDKGGSIEVASPAGIIQTRDVIVATNGYTGDATPWMQRRIIPIGSYIIATEPLAPGLVERLLPGNRIICDTRKVVYYYRLSPDRRRIIFGGRVSAAETNPMLRAPKLHRQLRLLFPELAVTRISHSWMGYVAFTFDSMAKCGKHENVHYALGYCGSGIASSSYLGHKTAQALLGSAATPPAIFNLPFSTRPFYTGNPWFLGAAVKYYQLLDRLI